MRAHRRRVRTKVTFRGRLGDPNAKDEDRVTPLHAAAKGGSAKSIAALLAAGADPIAKDASGTTPLHMAAEKGHAKAIATLLAADADPIAQDDSGTTPLHVATEKGHAKTTAALIVAATRTGRKERFLVHPPKGRVAAGSYPPAAPAVPDVPN